MKPEEQLTYEERKRLFFEKVDSGYYTRPAKPKVAVVTLPVSQKIAKQSKQTRRVFECLLVARTGSPWSRVLAEILPASW